MDLTQAIILRIIDDLYKKPSSNMKNITNGNKISLTDENYLQMNKILSKKSSFIINLFNVHTLKSLFVSIFENSEVKLISRKSFKVKNKSSQKEYEVSLKTYIDEIESICEEITSTI